MNKSRAQWLAVVTKIPLQIEDLDKIPEISNDIKSMVRSNSKVFLGKEAPYCFLSHIESSYAEMTVGCNLRHRVISHPWFPLFGFILYGSGLPLLYQLP